MNANNRGFTIFTALLSGFVIGAVLSALLLYAFLPAQRLVGQIAPTFLTHSDVPAAPGYREFYISGVATLYKDRQSKGVSAPDALSIANNQLGQVSGDATPKEVAAMVRATYELAKTENIPNGDTGFFTVVEQNNLGELATQLEAVQNEPAKTSAYEQSRNTLRLLGLAGLVGLLALAALALRFAYGFDERSAATSGGLGNMAQQVIRSVPFNRPFQTAPPQAAPPAQNVVVVQQPAMVVQQPAQVYAPPPVMASAGVPMPDPNATGHMQVVPTMGETFLTTFDPTSYRHGDDSYEESFTILGATGEYLGECGVSIADRLDLATPSKVCALGVWVFDKNDPQFKSVMKVLMTPNAYNDPIIRNKLARLGDHVLAQNGMFDIQTETMRVEATVSDLAVNPGGYFDNVNLAFNVYRKGAV